MTWHPLLACPCCRRRLSQMVEEMTVAALGSLAVSPILFFGIKLRGLFWMFW